MQKFWNMNSVSITYIMQFLYMNVQINRAKIDQKTKMILRSCDEKKKLTFSIIFTIASIMFAYGPK